jgi:hypothetical protein
MPLSQSALSELLDAFGAGDGADVICDSVDMVMQELIEVEANERIGAGRYERTDERVTDRNGTRPRLVATQAGDIEVCIPAAQGGCSSRRSSGVPPHRPGLVRGRHGGLCRRCLHRPRRTHARGIRDQQVRGLPHSPWAR